MFLIIVLFCNEQDKDRYHKEVETENSDDETSDSTEDSTGYKVKPVTAEKIVEPQSPNTERADAEIGEILDTLLLELPEVCVHIARMLYLKFTCDFWCVHTEWNWNKNRDRE